RRRYAQDDRSSHHRRALTLHFVQGRHARLKGLPATLSAASSPHFPVHFCVQIAFAGERSAVHPSGNPEEQIDGQY
ncbi:MAG: hypothetical protein KA745_09565, partial [Gemmatimonadales bacterium]|nr:hypothetical protein [Gemmatimonadales bacterium]